MPATMGKPEILLKALLDIGQELIATTDLDELLARILRISRDVFRFENAIIRLVDDKGEMLVTAAAYGYSEAASSTTIPLGRGVMGRVALSGKPILVENVCAQPDYLAGILGARSELAVPLIAREKVIGVFNVESPLPGAFAAEDIPPLMAMAAQAAIAIENARLYQNLRRMSGRYQELHQLNERILKSVNLGIYTVDDQLKITSWNRSIAEMSGVSEEEALGRDLFALFPGLEEEGFGTRVRRVLEQGRAENLRLAHRNFKGEMRIQKRRLAPLKDGERTTGAVVIVEDVTEFKRLLEQTIQSEKLAEVGRLSAGIAHEVNNPLAVISYAAQLLLREESLPPYQQELVERVESEVERLKALTGSLLSFSRAQEMVRRSTDVNEVLRDVLRLVRYELSRNHIDLVEDYGDLPWIKADPNKIKQVLINLIMNATQAMGATGRLLVATRPVAGAEVEVEITDSGPGIPEEIQKQIFDPFFTTKREGEGTGLGLYICRNIVIEHEGRLLVESGAGGTTFRMVLPVG
ncbi:nitrogen fixation transcript antitermination sensor histidine kinase [Desulfuromonas sp. DDH964]|uniref:ATP-binding protein n=1 Tax=Desulfuromonas sp. DDH964 TaxID=1823759 RepID=UPI00078EBBF2|nr:ATP-binding protein [Desulfuromonas sp. DDH964]AMV71711.1 nitrogen fixation transcript antitermination sensor histidine kinase [Desulfuromonas sp. DDH964]